MQFLHFQVWEIYFSLASPHVSARVHMHTCLWMYVGIQECQWDSNIFLVNSCMKFWRNLLAYRFWLLCSEVDLIMNIMVVFCSSFAYFSWEFWLIRTLYTSCPQWIDCITDQLIFHRPVWMAKIVLQILCIRSGTWALIAPYKIDGIVPALQMRTLKLRKIKHLTQGHMFVDEGSGYFIKRVCVHYFIWSL